MINTTITKEEAKAKIASLAAFMLDGFASEYQLSRFVGLSLKGDEQGRDAEQRMTEALSAMGIASTFQAGVFADYAGCAKELILSAYATVATQRDWDFKGFINMLNTEFGVDLSTEAVFRVIDAVPTEKRRNAQFGVHLEEIGEMFDECKSNDSGLNAKMQLANTLIKEIATEFKTNGAKLIVTNRKAFGDSLQDQVVTAKGVGHTQGMHMPENEARVSVANMSKNVDGVPSWLEGGKWAKGPFFIPPELRD